MRSAFTLLLLSSILTAQTPPTPNGSEIHQIFLADQADRGSSGNRFTLDQVPKRDAVRLARAKALLGAGQLNTAEDLHDAAFVFQHSLKTEDYLTAHLLATAAVAKGDRRSLWIAAATLDRYLQAIGQPQVFGTQYTSKAFLYFRAHPVNPDLNDPAAKDDATTQQPYNAALLPDSLRSTFCVVDEAEQKRNMERLKRKEDLVRSPPGCSD